MNKHTVHRTDLEAPYFCASRSATCYSSAFSCWRMNAFGMLGMLSVLPLSEFWWRSRATFEVHLNRNMCTCNILN